MGVGVVGNARRTASSAKALVIVERALHSPTSFDAVRCHLSGAPRRRFNVL